uniref:Hemicentin-1-like n=1 Tax=Saccoglossus kowalevskii TaxID=10224 RepID=A0ABM0MJH0_SACKO
MSAVDVNVPQPITYGLVGYDTTLICVYKTNFTRPILTWYDGFSGTDEIIILQEMDGVVYVNPDYQDRFSLTGQASLRINDTQLGDSNDYECEVSACGKIDRGSTYLAVSESQSPDCTLQHNTQPVEGDNVVLTCTTEGIPPPTVQWFKDGYLIEESERYTFSEDGTELTILNTQRVDSGVYICNVTNLVGSSSCYDLIDVWYLPNDGWPNCTVSDEPSTGYFQEGEQIVITCGATGGNPTPELYWHDDNFELMNKSCFWNEQHPIYELTISSCTWELESSDNGRVYTCTGKSDASSETYDCDTGQLDVKYAPDSPTCNVTAENNLFKEGNEITLTCVSLDGNPLATLQWVNTSSGMVMTGTTPGPNDSESIATHSWTLSRTDNTGVYVCGATNIIQTDPLICSSGPLNVSFAAMVILLSEPNNPYKRGDYVTLTCTSSSSNPPSSIGWYRNNTLVMNSDYETVVDTDHIDEPFPCQTSLTGHDGHVMAGEEIILTCTSCSSNPQAELIWYVDDMEVQDGLSVPRYTHAEYNGKQTSQNLTKLMTYLDHGAVIYCEAYNPEFNEEMNSSNKTVLNVHYSPFIENTDEAVIKADVMETANLTCEVNSNPDSNITWYDSLGNEVINCTDRSIIVEIKKDTIQTSVLLITNVTYTDYGNYTCYAENYINMTYFVVYLSGTSIVFYPVNGGQSYKTEILICLMCSLILIIVDIILVYFIRREDWMVKSEDQMTRDQEEPISKNESVKPRPRGDVKRIVYKPEISAKMTVLERTYDNVPGEFDGRNNVVVVDENKYDESKSFTK